jgi:D-glycero-alpha-D-manno-heptose 1-phosphate guanylyltransferase
MLHDILILAGGFGTRLKEISGGIPKALMPVGQKVFIDFIFNWLQLFKVSRVILSLHYRAELFQKYISEHSFPFNIETVIEPYPLGTGGAIKYAIHKIKASNPFFVLNGDTYVNVNLGHMQDFFYKMNFQAMIGLSRIAKSDRYGLVQFDGYRAVGFYEKGSLTEGWVNNGIYILKKELFLGLPEKFSIEKDLFPQLVKKHKLFVFPTESVFYDIGIPEDYHRFLQENTPN